jgi:uncharacterized protein
MQIAVQILEQFYAAINRHDLETATQHFHPDIVRIEPEGFPSAGTYRGVAQIREHLAQGRGSWAEGNCDPEGFWVNGDRVVVDLYAWVRLHGASDWSGGRFADGFEFCQGRIIQYHSFADRAAARAWAGIAEASSP